MKALICRLVGHTVDALTGACHRCRDQVLDPIGGPLEGDPMNVYTTEELEDRECRRSCPRPGGGFPDDGQVTQCPHGRWFIAEVRNRPVWGGLMAEWRPARPWDKRRIREALKETR